MFLLFAQLLACTNQMELVYGTDACSDWDFDNTEAELRIEETAEGISISRVGVERPCDDLFQPEIVADGWRIQITEGWEIDVPGDCTACTAPTVELIAPAAGTYTIQWFEGAEFSTPVHDVEYEVE